MSQMRGSTVGLAAFVLGLVGTVGLGALERRLGTEEMAEASREFLASLSDEQRERATFAFDSDERERHHFIPSEMWERRGVSMKEMNGEQRDRAQDLLRAGLSERGHMTANEIMEVEGILARLEGEDRQFARDPEDYWVSVFGTPATDGTWGWRWEGHHLSLHFTMVEGELSVSTPTFLATNPAVVPEGPREGLRALADQEDSARELLASLDVAQRDIAIFDDVAPTDVVTGAALEVDPLDPVGIEGSALSGAQRELLLAVIDSYASVMADDIAELRMAKVREDGIGNVRFAWAGGTERGEVAYYRVQGPSFLIEFDNTQNDPNHIHTTWRDFEGDLGRDLLREHLGQDH